MELIALFSFFLIAGIIYAVVAGYLYRWLNRRFPQWCLNVRSPFATSAFVAVCYFIELSVLFSTINFWYSAAFIILFPPLAFFIASDEKDKLTKPKQWLVPSFMGLILPLLFWLRTSIYLLTYN